MRCKGLADVLAGTGQTTHSLLHWSLSPNASAKWYSPVPWCISCPDWPLTLALPAIVHPHQRSYRLLHPGCFTDKHSRQSLSPSRSVTLNYFQTGMICLLLASHYQTMCIWTVSPALWKDVFPVSEGWLSLNVRLWYKTHGRFVFLTVHKRAKWISGPTLRSIIHHHYVRPTAKKKKKTLQY